LLVKVSVALAAPVVRGLKVTVKGRLWPAEMASAVLTTHIAWRKDI
jgi:hypothetical protein